MLLAKLLRAPLTRRAPWPPATAAPKSIWLNANGKLAWQAEPSAAFDEYVSDPAKPREVSRLSLPERWHMPHWISADRKRGRIAVTGQYAGWLAMLKFDATTGSLSIDEGFGDRGRPKGLFHFPLRYQLLGKQHGRTASQIDEIVFGDVGQRLTRRHGEGVR